MILIDTNIFVSYENIDDINHEKAVNLIKKIEKGDYRQIAVLDHVLSETLTVLYLKQKKFNVAVGIGKKILAIYPILFLDKHDMENAFDIFSAQKSTKYSFPDCAQIALAKNHGIEYIATFDEEFKKSGIKIVNK